MVEAVLGRIIITKQLLEEVAAGKEDKVIITEVCRRVILIKREIKTLLASQLEAGDFLMKEIGETTLLYKGEGIDTVVYINDVWKCKQA